MQIFNATTSGPSGGILGRVLGGPKPAPRLPVPQHVQGAFGVVPQHVQGSYRAPIQVPQHVQGSFPLPKTKAAAKPQPAPNQQPQQQPGYTPPADPQDPYTAPYSDPYTTPGQPAAGVQYGPGSPFDITGDPSIAAINLANQRAYADTVAAQQANAKQALIGAGFNFGDLLGKNPSLGNSEIGSVFQDSATAQAAQGNPFSIAAQLSRTHQSNNVGINQGANDRNLYHSSTRANTLGDEATGYLGAVTGAENDLLSSLTGNIGSILAEKQRESDAYQQTVLTARQNAVQNGIQSGAVFLGYDANGNPILSHPLPQASQPDGYQDPYGQAPSGLPDPQQQPAEPQTLEPQAPDQQGDPYAGQNARNTSPRLDPTVKPKPAKAKPKAKAKPYGGQAARNSY